MQWQGEIHRDPRTSDSESSMHAFESSDDLAEGKMNFCCVDYKKKKVSPVKTSHVKEISGDNMGERQKNLGAQEKEGKPGI